MDDGGEEEAEETDTMLAFRYTTLTSVTLLNALAIPMGLFAFLISRFLVEW